MNERMDDLLQADGRRWLTAQPPPPALEDAIRTATTPRGHRARIAVALAAVAVLAISTVAAIPFVRSIGNSSTDQHGPGSSPTRSSEVVRQLTERARAAATSNHDPHATAEAVLTTYALAERYVLGGDTSPSPPGTTEVWVIQVHGSFTCTSCSRPPGVPAQTGTALALVLDAHTLVSSDFAITQAPHDLTKLGTPIQLPL